jgi:addiction module HigA family antidote
MEPLGLSVSRLSEETSVSRARIYRILSGKAKMKPDMAKHLGEYFGVNSDFWMGLQKLYDARIAENVGMRKRKTGSGRKELVKEV